MQVAGVNCVLPSNEIDNEEVIDLVRYHSRSVYSGNLSELEVAIRRGLNTTGIRSRFWRTRDERPLDLIRESWQALSAASGFVATDVDIVIYVGIDRGFIEPANACFIARHLGMTKAQAFDIVDGCMGWCTALQISQALLGRGDARHVLIVSSECPMDEVGAILPRSYTIANIGELRWKLPAFTIGEAVSTTLLRGSEQSWNFCFSADSSKADLCTIPLYKFADYSDDSEKLRTKHQFEFSAYGFNLYAAGYADARAVLRKALQQAPRVPTLILPHSVSEQVTTRTADELALGGRFFSTFARTGNIATSSVPANIHFAMSADKLAPGDYCLGWISGAGLKHAAFDIYL